MNQGAHRNVQWPNMMASSEELLPEGSLFGQTVESLSGLQPSASIGACADRRHNRKQEEGDKEPAQGESMKQKSSCKWATELHTQMSKHVGIKFSMSFTFQK